MSWSVESIITGLFSRWYGTGPSQVTPLPPSGSSRQYFRVHAGSQTFIAAFNPDVRENKAFLEMTRHFRQLGFPVPDILAEDTDGRAYLISDLGDTTLFSLLPHNQTGKEFDSHITGLYKKAIDWLAAFQVRGADGLNFDVCYPRQAFDRHSMSWDLNYFKYYFLKIAGIAFDEQKLEDSFDLFTAHLLKEKAGYFMYRDFQSRNIMVVSDQPYFIDYQGGRRGPLQYDIASLLFDAKANVPFSLRYELLDYYIAGASAYPGFDEQQFRAYYYDFVLIRVMQALATYGFRGGVEKKPVFLQSMPFALNNIRWLAENGLLPAHNPYLTEVMERVAATAPADFPPPPREGLTVSIRSFSYRRGIPGDDSGNGGGFVFDCRSLTNPGRLDEYKHLTGKSPLVERYMRDDDAFHEFINPVMHLVDRAVDNYLERGFSHLMVNFGCTGGQHRSVFCAEMLARHIREKYTVHTDLQHMEEKNWPDSHNPIPQEQKK